MRIAYSKQQALDYRTEEIRFGYEAELISMLQWFLTDIGAEKQFSGDEEHRLTELKRYHEKLSVDNHAYPSSIPFHIVYPRFFTAVVNNAVERKGNNVSALIGAFRSWISVSGQVEKLQEAYYKQHPEEKPKELPVTGVDTHEDAENDRLCRGVSVEKWPDKVIIDQHKKICQVMSDEKFQSWIEGLGGSGYIKRIFNEAEKRGLVTLSSNASPPVR